MRHVYSRPTAAWRALPLALAAALVISGCGGAKKQDGPPPLSVDVGTVAREDLATYANLDGQIAPVQESLLSTPQSGNVISVAVHEGDRVTQGQVLAKLDDSTLRAQLAANEADLAQNRAKLQSASVQAPISAVGYNSSLESSRNALATAEAALANAKLVYTSNQDLYPKGYVSQTALEQSRSQYVAAQQQVNSAKADLARAQQNMQSTQVDQATVAAAKAAVESSAANVQLLQTQISQTNIVAPFNGVVTQRLLDPGAYASANAPVVRVSQLDPVYVNFNVPDDLLAYVKPGTPVTFVTSSLPGRTFTAKVASVNATPTSGTLSYRAQIREPNPDGALRGGMLVTVRVRKDFRSQTTVVARSAVESGEAGSYIYTIKDGKADKLPVKVGLQTDTQSEVTGPGVTAGLQVITTRPDALQDGSVVAIAGPAPAGAAASPAPKKAQ